jgi:tRNA (cytidine32/guanosine34-2'-O)-methyltransferase
VCATFGVLWGRFIVVGWCLRGVATGRAGARVFREDWRLIFLSGGRESAYLRCASGTYPQSMQARELHSQLTIESGVVLLGNKRRKRVQGKLESPQFTRESSTYQNPNIYTHTTPLLHTEQTSYPQTSPKMGKSSKDKRDAYYRLAKEEGWRARSAYKLLQLDEEFALFANVTRVVDLCAAPGSWSQVLSRVLIQGEKFGRAGWHDKQAAVRANVLGPHAPVEEALEKLAMDEKPKPKEGVRIVAIDLQPMSPLPGVTCLRADITHPSTVPLLLAALDPPTASSSFSAATSTTASDPSSSPTETLAHNPSTPTSSPVDLVLSDGAPDVTGLHDLDIYVQSQLLWAALNLALRVLKPGGKFVAKIFRGKDVDVLFAQLRLCFERVRVAKPRSSRASSIEAFVVCEGFRGGMSIGAQVSKAVEAKSAPTRTVRADDCVEVDLGDETESEEDDVEEGGKRWIAPFLACGDLSAYDSDATYNLPKDRVSLDPVQPPTAPPYRRALEMRKVAGGAYGKTKSK